MAGMMWVHGEEGDGLCVYVQQDIKLRKICLYSNMYQDAFDLHGCHATYKPAKPPPRYIYQTK